MKNAHIIIDLGFGDAGKGSMTDYFARTTHSDLVIRFSGGAQAAHNVVTDEVHHSFRQFGSGTLSGARTLYSKHALFDPIMYLDEANMLKQKGVHDPAQMFFVERDCIITTIFQQAMNRIRETVREGGRHGSCGLGIGETASDKEEIPEHALSVGDLEDSAVTLNKLLTLQRIKFAEAGELVKNASQDTSVDMEILSDPQFAEAAALAYLNIRRILNVIDHATAIRLLRESHAPIFEGSQGILLDQDHGFYPYITRSDVTATNAVAMASEAGMRTHVTGLLRAYAVRHGAGPMPTEDASLSECMKDYHNAYGVWQGEVRVGYFDAVLARHAIRVSGGIDDLIITSTDRLQEMNEVKVCTEYLDQTALHMLALGPLSHSGKPKKREQSERLSQQIPLCQRFSSIHEKSTIEYQVEYARHIAKELGEDIRLAGISHGAKASEKLFF